MDVTFPDGKELNKSGVLGVGGNMLEMKKRLLLFLLIFDEDFLSEY